MAFLKIVAVALLATISSTHCSIVAPAVALPAVRYTQVAPPSVLPFSAQVNTFTRNLNVFDAPYAAGVYPGAPAIVQRFLPAAPAPFLPAPVAPLSFAAGGAPLPAQVIPAAPVAGFPLPAGLVGRSVHAVAPAVAPAFSTAPLLG